MKKVILTVMALMVFILPLTMTYNQQQASANIISKPLTITAKKVAKDLAKDSAVAMAEHIAFEMAMNQFLNGPPPTEQGYEPVCLDGKTKKYEDCPSDKRAQVKKDLTSSDRSKLASTVENVLERKTNTSAKWQKFLDFFIPIFLISGLVATFDAMLDGDSESFIDEVAQQALIDAGLLKPLKGGVGGGGSNGWKNKDFSTVVDSVTTKITEGSFSSYSVTFAMKQGFYLKINHSGTVTSISGVGRTINVKVETGAELNQEKKLYRAKVYHSYFYNGSSNYGLPNAPEAVFLGEYKHKVYTDAAAEARAFAPLYMRNTFYPNVPNPTVNDILNTFFGNLNALMPLSVDVIDLNEPEVETDYGTQTGLDKTKNPDGTKTLPGVDSYTYTYNNTYVFPATDSTTGWKDKTTGEDITVVEDDVIVEDGTTPIDPDTPPPPGEEDNPNTDKDKDKVKDKSRKWSALLTDRFPFSLPWDFLHLMGFLFADPMTPKWEIRGTEKIPLNFTIDLKFFDPYAPWFRTFIFLSFVVSVIFLHGRFMGGSK